MGEPKIAAKRPAVIELDAGTYYWCQCGQSTNQPFCDGSHQGTEFMPVELTLDEKKTESVAQLTHLPLWTSDGERVPLASLAEFKELPGAERIQRDDRLTSVWVGARYEEGTRDDYMPLITATMNNLEMPYGYSWTFGRWQQRQ